jgi:protein-disulfide isomerase
MVISRGQLMNARLRNNALNALTVLVTVGALATIVVKLRRAGDESGDARPRIVQGWREYATSGDRLGTDSAPVTITVFSDFQCPFCRRTDAELSNLRRNMPTRISVVYRNYPLSFHAYAGTAAIAAICAGFQGAFDAYRAELFSRQDSLASFNWHDAAARTGVADVAAFDACMVSDKAHRVLHSDSAAAIKLGVHATPTMLINNVELIGGDSAVVDSLVRQQLNVALQKKLGG